MFASRKVQASLKATACLYIMSFVFAFVPPGVGLLLHPVAAIIGGALTLAFLSADERDGRVGAGLSQGALTGVFAGLVMILVYFCLTVLSDGAQLRVIALNLDPTQEPGTGTLVGIFAGVVAGLVAAEVLLGVIGGAIGAIAFAEPQELAAAKA